jgi:hypothetical protein
MFRAAGKTLKAAGGTPEAAGKMLKAAGKMFKTAGNDKNVEGRQLMAKRKRQLNEKASEGGAHGHAPLFMPTIAFLPSRHRNRAYCFINRRGITGLVGLPTRTTRSGRPLADFGLASWPNRAGPGPVS